MSDQELAAGSAAPDFTLESDAGESVTLSSLKGKGVILYFYPKDNTAGCTAEAQGFRDHRDDFAALRHAHAAATRFSAFRATA